MTINRELRNRIAILLFTLSVSSVVASIGKHAMLVRYGAMAPDPASGLLYPLANKGRDVYVSASQITGISILTLVALLAFLSCILIVPKNYPTPLPKETPPPLVGGAFQTDIAVSRSRPQFWLQTLAIAFVSLLLYLLIEPIADVLVTSGIILRVV